MFWQNILIWPSWNLLDKSRLLMDEWTVKTTNPICRLFFKIDLLTEFVSLCLTDFINWRYVHSLVGIFDQASELLPPWTKELLSCTVAPLSSLWPPPLPKLNEQYIQTACVWGAELCCRPYSAGILHSVSDQIQNLPNCFTIPNKMTSEDDIKGLVSLKFLRPWGYWIRERDSHDACVCCAPWYSAPGRSTVPFPFHVMSDLKWRSWLRRYTKDVPSPPSTMSQIWPKEAVTGTPVQNSVRVSTPLLQFSYTKASTTASWA